MSDDERRDDDNSEDEDDKGLGLTEEFKRLEDEIGREGRRDVRFDETDSSEWVAPVQRSEPADEGNETDEWAAPASLGDIHEDGGEDEPEPEDEFEDEKEPEADEPPASEPEAIEKPEAAPVADEPAAESDSPALFDAEAEAELPKAKPAPEPAKAEEPVEAEADADDDAPAEDEAEAAPEKAAADSDPKTAVAPAAAAATSADADAKSADPSGDDSDATPAADSEEGVHAGVPDSPAKVPEPVAAAAASAAAADEPATEHTVVRKGPLATPIPAGAGGRGGGEPPLYTDEDIEDKTPALWWRFLAASVMIIVAVATSVALSGLLAFNDVIKDFRPLKTKDGALTEVQPGEPFTILIVGSDKRSNTPGDPGRSDTTMLLRVDPQDSVLSLFSLPRDLKVDIPGYGTAKLNEAYTDGGVNKTLETVKDLTSLKINYVVNVDFQGFADAVDSIGCVYVDVDRKYFNDNSTAYSADEQFAAIDINAGYQRLCGQNALDYVRYRHTDSDFVRAARQQDFLRNARAQVPVSEILPIIGGDKGSDLLDIFTKYTATTIETPAQLIDLLRSLITVRDVPVNEVHFNGQDTLENGISYVTADQSSIDKAVNQFLGDQDSAGGPDSGPSKPDKSKGDSGGSSKDESSKPAEDKQPDSSGADVISTEDSAAQYCADLGGVDKVAAFGRTSARRVKFPVYVPTVQVPGSCYDEGSRQYDIKDPDDNKQSAYKLVFNLNSSSAAGEYYGVEGTEWSSPPILEKKSETVTMGDRDYDLYYDGDRLRLVAFHVDDNSYWVSNTLLQSLSADQMLAIAKSMTEAHGK